LRILIVTPAVVGSRSGNRVTAMRWARLLRQLGHRVDVSTDFERQRPDLLIALHARRSHSAIATWRQQRGDAPLVLALTGTDLYKDIHTDTGAQASLEWADRFIILQEAGLQQLPQRYRRAVHIIVQSVKPPQGDFSPLQRAFEVCVLGHLREVKDPFRTAEATHLLPATSKLLVSHAGGALDPGMSRRAQRETEQNPHYRWLGELPRWRAIRLLARARALILTSIMEGGANVVSEAIACGIPVISSRISGSIGLLGADYPGYFEVGDTQGLAEQLARLETDSAHHQDLQRRVVQRAHMVDPATERQSLHELIETI
jgi:putative glycosyltransferase (TIGR04348 family)